MFIPSFTKCKLDIQIIHNHYHINFIHLNKFRKQLLSTLHSQTETNTQMKISLHFNVFQNTCKHLFIEKNNQQTYSKRIRATNK